MTKTLKILTVAAGIGLTAAFAPFEAGAQSIVPPAGTIPPYYPTGIGPAVAGSVDITALPEKALDFLGKTFSDDVIIAIEKEFSPEGYDVDLACGIELEFDARGEWTEVDMNHGALPTELVKKLVPHHVWRKLEDQQATGRVETIKRSGKSIKIELLGAEVSDLKFSL